MYLLNCPVSCPYIPSRLSYLSPSSFVHSGRLTNILFKFLIPYSLAFTALSPRSSFCERGSVGCCSVPNHKRGFLPSLSMIHLFVIFASSFGVAAAVGLYPHSIAHLS